MSLVKSVTLLIVALVCFTIGSMVCNEESVKPVAESTCPSDPSRIPATNSSRPIKIEGLDPHKSNNQNSLVSIAGKVRSRTGNYHPWGISLIARPTDGTHTDFRSSVLFREEGSEWIGSFLFESVRPGTYQLRVGDKADAYVWSPEFTAVKAGAQTVELIAEDAIERERIEQR